MKYTTSSESTCTTNSPIHQFTNSPIHQFTKTAKGACLEISSSSKHICNKLNEMRYM